MKKFSTFKCLTVVLLSLLLGCGDNKQYTYIEIMQKEVKSEDALRKYKAAQTISRPTDSAAYVDAFVKFCTSLSVHEKVYSAGDKLFFHPAGFMLMNENGIVISNSVTFKNKDSVERQIEREIKELTKLTR